MPVFASKPMIYSSQQDPVVNYLLCRWSELCWPSAPITVSAPMMSSRSVLRELLELDTARTENVRVEMKSDLLIEEAAQILANDPVLPLIDVCGATMEDASAWRKYLLHGQQAPDDWRRRTSRCRAILRLMEDAGYFERAVESVIELVADNRNILTKYAALDRLLGIIASHAIGVGFDAAFLFKRAWVSNRWEGPLDIPSFFSRLLRHPSTYDVYLKLPPNAESPTELLPTNVAPYDGSLASTSKLAGQFFAGDNKQFLKATGIAAADEHAAVTKAFLHVQQAHAIISVLTKGDCVRPELQCLACPQKTPQKALLVRVSSPATHYAPLHHGSMGHLLHQAVSEGMFTAAASLAAVGGAEISLTARFMFNWIALEQVAVANQSGATAEVIADALAPMLALHAPNRSIHAVVYRWRYLTEDRQQALADAMGLGLEQLENVELASDRLRDLLQGDETTALDAVQQRLMHTDAVGYARFAYFRSPSWAEWKKKRISTDHAQIRQQINRLWRIRNRLIHNNVTLEAVEAVRHLEFYLGECLYILLREMQSQEITSPVDVFELERLRYEAMTK